MIVNLSSTLTRMFSRPVHFRARDSQYPGSKVTRFPVPDSKVDWSESFPDYKPVNYSSGVLTGKPWADPEIGSPLFNPKWNSLDGNVDRKSLEGPYQVDNGIPRNPRGRTGICGRGLLGRWGPNHAADPIVTRWKRINDKIVLDETSKKPVLEFVAIQRRDSGEWAIPGGMVDPGEKVSATLKREFLEEALNDLEASQDKRHRSHELISSFFNNGYEVYSGYVDDPRNTDNAWMETVAYNFHDDDGKVVGMFSLESGDDASAVRWHEINSQVILYASHKDILSSVVMTLGAHW